VPTERATKKTKRTNQSTDRDHNPQRNQLEK